MSARDMALALLDQDPATFVGEPPPFPTFPGHRHAWLVEAFALLRECETVAHENAAAWMNLLNQARWDICGGGDAALFAWHQAYEGWALEVAEQNSVLAAEKRGAK